MTMTRRRPALTSCLALLALLLAACADGAEPQTFRATVPPTVQSAPIYTDTPTRTPSPTPTVTPSPTATATPTVTPTLTPTVTPTQPLFTLTPVARGDGASAFVNEPAPLAPTAGWSCGDFPCEDDIAGFLRRIRVPVGYAVEHVGRFPGAPGQIAYGPDGRLYATVIDNPAARTGAVYVLEADGSAARYSGDFVAPAGLAFQPGTDVLYVSARVTLEEGGGLWRVPPGGGAPVAVLDDLPCCFALIDNQPNGLIFGPDGYLYLGVGALTDRAEPPDPRRAQMADLHPYEAAVLRIQPHTGAVEVYAQGLRNPFDLTFDSAGQFYATDQGLLSGQGDRVVALDEGAHYGWPYWRGRGCFECPLLPGRLAIAPDLLTFPPYSIPRGLVAYTGDQFPANLADHLFIALWNGTEDAQRVVRLDPRDPPRIDDPDDPDALARAEPFVTGLIRPIDVAIAPDGALVVADFIYGHVWAVRYTG